MSSESDKLRLRRGSVVRAAQQGSDWVITQWPEAEGAVVAVDIANTAVARGKIYLAENRGERPQYAFNLIELNDHYEWSFKKIAKVIRKHHDKL